MKQISAILFIFGSLLSTNLSLAFEVPKHLSHVGGGDFKWYFINLYKADFYSESKTFDLEKSFALKLTYNKSLKGHLIAERSGEEMVYVGSSKEVAESWVKELKTIFPDVKSGESLTGYYQPNVGTTFYYQDKKVKTILGQDFAKAFFSIWLSEKTRASELRSKLLGFSK